MPPLHQASTQPTPPHHLHELVANPCPYRLWVLFCPGATGSAMYMVSAPVGAALKVTCAASARLSRLCVVYVWWCRNAVPFGSAQSRVLLCLGNVQWKGSERVCRLGDCVTESSPYIFQGSSPACPTEWGKLEHLQFQADGGHSEQVQQVSTEMIAV